MRKLLLAAPTANSKQKKEIKKQNMQRKKKPISRSGPVQSMK